MIIGTGSEILVQTGLERVRGSSFTVDQRIVQEDEAGRAVTAITAAFPDGLTLGSYPQSTSGVYDRYECKNVGLYIFCTHKFFVIDWYR